MKRLGLAISILVVLSMLLAACGAAPEPEVVEKVVTQIVQETVVVEGETQIVEKVVTVVSEVEVAVEVEKVVTPTPEPQEPVVILQGAEVITLDPHIGQSIPDDNVHKHLFQTLTRWNANIELEPYMAESWESIDDVTWEFKIKEGYTFHNGEPVNAEAFKFALDRGQEMFETGTGRTSYEYGLLNLEEVIAVDEYTLQVVTKAPNPLIPGHMAHVQAAAQPPQYVTEVGDEEFGLTGIGSGPYIVTEFNPEEVVVMERWEDYAGEKPDIQTIIWRAVPEAATRINELKAGNADIITNVPPDLALSVDKAPGVHMAPVNGMRRIFMGMGQKETDHPAMKDVRVRQAINYAFNCDAMMSSLLAGAGECSAHIINDPNASPNVEPYPYDPELAGTLLDEAGWAMGADGVREKDGQKLAFEMDCPNGRYIKDRDMCLVFASDLAEVGIDVTVNVLDWSVFIDHASSQGAGFPTMHLIGSGPGFNCRSDLGYIEANTGSNRSQYANDEITALFAELDATFDPDARLQLCHQIEELAVDDAAVVQVYMQVDFYAASDRMDWEPRADERIMMTDAKLR
jgi:peptide/nickel transport system substrate-binding protein